MELATLKCRQVACQHGNSEVSDAIDSLLGAINIAQRMLESDDGCFSIGHLGLHPLNASTGFYSSKDDTFYPTVFHATVAFLHGRLTDRIVVAKMTVADLHSYLGRRMIVVKKERVVKRALARAYAESLMSNPSLAALLQSTGTSELVDDDADLPVIPLDLVVRVLCDIRHKMRCNGVECSVHK